jgi:hypothetical protein
MGSNPALSNTWVGSDRVSPRSVNIRYTLAIIYRNWINM